jgi:branched-chain amino acid transport system permease protein
LRCLFFCAASRSLCGVRRRGRFRRSLSGAWSIGPFLVTKRLLIGAVLTVGLVELLHWFFMHTRQGLRLAAVAEDHYTALSLGVSVRQAVAVAWIMGAVLSAVGSVVLLSDQIVSLNAAGIGLRALPIALLGGMESVRGALLAGAIIGVGEALASVMSIRSPRA